MPIKYCIQVFTLLFLFVFVSSCTNTNRDTYIIVGVKATKTELITAKHLKNDLENALKEKVQIIDEADGIPSSGFIFFLGTSLSNRSIAGLAKKGSIILSDNFPGSRGGIWAKLTLENGCEAIVLAGSDVQGMQYAVYDYCNEIIGVDPFEYWSGITSTPQKNIFDIQNKVISPPEIPMLCYFENDVDELANIKKPMLEYDYENYTQMINSLVRIKYNAIQLFDMLGRPEFFLRPEYKKIRPDYDIRISYIDSMINYAHDMGMKVQIDMALGYKIKPIEQEKADCWAKNRNEWIDTWKYYFEETPLGKADIFALRPRNQVWDWEYKSSCNEDKIDVFNEVYAVLGDLIDEYNPKATKVVLCYHDGMEMFNNGFNPPEDWIIAWSDNGWGDFDFLPEDTKGYDFGTYMHAGFWLNHTIHDPCPVIIDTVMKRMVNHFGANKYCMVNGQQFRPFLINIEAFSKMADNVNSFNGELFYYEWAARYFGEDAAKYAVNSMTKLHEAQFNKVGYVQHLWEIREAISYLSDLPIERPGKMSIPSEYRRVENDFEHVAIRVKLLKESLEAAKKGEKLVNNKGTFYNDYIVLPTEIYADLLAFECELHKMAKLKKQFEDTGDKGFIELAVKNIEKTRFALQQVYDRRMSGDKNPMWAGWYNPNNRRPNNGFPTPEMIDVIELNLKNMK